MNRLLRAYSRRSWAARLGIGFVIAGLLVACASTEPSPETLSPTPAALPIAPTLAPIATPIGLAATEAATALPTPMPDFLKLPTLARGYLTTPNELRRIAALARAGDEPYKAAVKAELGYAKDALGQEALSLPATLQFDDDINTPPYLSTGSKHVYAWALAYNLLRDAEPEQAEAYAQHAHYLIMGMP